MKLNDFIGTVKAGQMLGVSSQTLGKWEKKGLLVPVRHPINKRRLYKKEDLEAILNKLNRDAQALSLDLDGQSDKK